MQFVGTVLEWVVQYTVLLIWGYDTQSYLTAVSYKGNLNNVVACL